MSRKSECGCAIDIHIESRGDVHVYNCTTPVAPDAAPPSDCPPPAVPGGECIPIAAGAKHKRSRQDKLLTLADGNRVPSVLTTSTLHMARRFLLGKAPANQLETAVFDTFGHASARMRDTLSCAVSSFDALPSGERANLFDLSLDLDADQAIDPDTLSTAWVRELEQRAAELAFGDPEGIGEERPGRVRVFDPGPPEGEEFPEPQVRICRVNGLRTAGFRPLPDDWQPTELEQHCEVVWENGEPKLTCEIQQPPGCPGNEAAGACLRVPPVMAGDAVVLEGVNFFSTQATVLLVDKSLTTSRELEAHVWGDLDTPVNEDVGGQTVLINDCRVHDRLTFNVPEDLPPAIYQVQVQVPNITGIAALGDPVFSQVEYIVVEPPTTARFEVGGERLYARKETSPDFPGASDEVGLMMLSVPVFADRTLGEAQETRKRFSDVDTGESRDVNRPLFRNDQPIAALSLLIVGHEIDNDEAYEKQIDDWATLFFNAIKEQVAWLGGAGVVGKAIAASWWGAAIAIGVLLAIDALWALWAAADPIIGDVIGLSAVELATLTSASLPLPQPSKHSAPDDIRVNVTPLEKIPQQYSERREYVSHDTDSRYELYLRYTRLA